MSDEQEEINNNSKPDSNSEGSENGQKNEINK